MTPRWTILVLLFLSLGVDLVGAQDVKRLDADKAARIAAMLVDAASAMPDLPIKIQADTKRCIGLEANNRGGIVVPDSRLTADALKKVDRELLPIGFLFLHRITPSVAEQAVPADQHRQVTVTEDGKTVNVSVLPLAVTRVADRLVLLVFTNRKAPAIVTTLVELNESKDSPLDIDVRRHGDQQASLQLSVLGQYRAAFDVIAQD